MLICHKHRFIFVKTRKTGSTSVEIVLSRFCDGEWDVITPVLPRDRRFQKIAGVTAKNYRDEEGHRIFPGHHSASRIRKLVGNGVWSSYSTICVVRNPWSRVLSQFHFRQGRWRDPCTSFEDFVRQEQFTDESGFYRQNGRLIVDHVLRFETIREDLAQLIRYLNLDWDGWLPHANPGPGKNGSHYSDAYTPELVDIVARKCAREIKLFGYEFETRGSSASKMPAHISTGVLEKLGKNSTAGHPRSFDANAVAGNQCRPVRAANIQVLRQGDALVLRNIDNDQTYKLDNCADKVWKLCDGQMTVEDMLPVLRREFEAPTGLLSADLLVTLDRMKTLGQIEALDLHDVFSGRSKVLDLRHIKYYVITLGDERRKAFMTGQLERLGLEYEFVEAVTASHKKLSIALSHLKVLALPGLEVPFGVLEDDCQFADSIQYQHHLPVGTDALYLGTSRFGSKIPGRLSRAVWGNVRFVDFDPEYLRVFNMLARHAIIYVSESFRMSATQSVSDGIRRLGLRFPGDAYYAMLQLSHLVLTPKRPACFQSSALGGQQGATRRPLHAGLSRPVPEESEA